MNTIFWDVDTQHDFMRADGKLYVPDAESIRPLLRRLTEYAHGQGIRILASADDHLPSHGELSDHPDFHDTFPPHCMRHTPGQRKISETELRDPLVIEPEPADHAALRRRVRVHTGDLLFHKHRFDVFTNPNLEPVLDELAPDRVFLYGVALDVCVRYAIEGLLSRRPGTRLFAVTDAMKPIDAGRATELLAEWERRGVRLVSTTEAMTLSRQTLEPTVSRV